MTQIRRFGSFEVVLLQDGVLEAPRDALIHSGGSQLREELMSTMSAPTFEIDINCFALRGPTGLTLIDSGAGSSWGPAFGKARGQLQAAGVEPQSVQRILLTHIHDDHVQGLFEGEEPYFPNAQIWVSQRDLAFFTDKQAFDATPAARRGGFDMAALLQRICGKNLRTFSDHAIFDGIEALPLPGHTPGHTGYLLRDDRHPLLIWGDVVHLAKMQTASPQIGLVYDLDPNNAAKTRRAVLNDALQYQWTVAGAHISGFGRVTRRHEGMR